MEKLEIILPFSGETRASVLGAAYDLVQATPELGFHYRKALSDHVRENTERGTFWIALADGDVVGVAMIGSRRLYPHLARHGEVAVAKPYRRQRIATSLYVAQVLQCLFEGRRQVEDTIIPSLSPWMRGPCGDGQGFLPSLKYDFYGTLPQRTGGFRDIELWGKSVIEVGDLVERLPGCLSILQVSDSEKVQKCREKNLTEYEKHDAELTRTISSLIKVVEEIVPSIDIARPGSERKGLFNV